jgi:hypothetical protein
MRKKKRRHQEGKSGAGENMSGAKLQSVHETCGQNRATDPIPRTGNT